MKTLRPKKRGAALEVKKKKCRLAFLSNGVNPNKTKHKATKAVQNKKRGPGDSNLLKAERK